ncbi:hypothetical protein [Polaribacter pectinis]|nr:hypothetical protein [Polaribacter pectinis]
MNVLVTVKVAKLENVKIVRAQTVLVVIVIVNISVISSGVEKSLQ